MNKGVDVMHYFQAADKPGGMGSLPYDIAARPSDAAWDAVATPPMRALRARRRDAFAGLAPPASPVQLDVDVLACGPVGQVFAGDERHPPLTHEDVFAFLPFQVNTRRLVIPVYVMTYDVSRRMPEVTYEVLIRGVDRDVKSLRMTDPITGRCKQLQSSGGEMR